MVTSISDYKKKVERQIENEAEMRNRGGKRTLDRENKSINKERESMTTHGKKLLKASIDKYEVVIENFLNENNRGPKFVAKKYLDQLDRVEKWIQKEVNGQKNHKRITNLKKFRENLITKYNEVNP